MAKRLTDTEKWKKQFVRSLPAPYKLLYFYVLDACDHAGIWDVDIEVAQLYTGSKLDETKAIQLFDGKIMVMGGGAKWFLPDFIAFQYGELNENNNAHKSVIKRLNKWALLDQKNEVLVSPSSGALDKDKDKEVVKDKVKDKGAHLFKNSPFAPLDLFIQKMQEAEKYACFDHEYYHEVLMNWSAEGKMKKDWIATAKNWMLRDLKDGKARLSKDGKEVINGTAADVANWGR